MLSELDIPRVGAGEVECCGVGVNSVGEHFRSENEAAMVTQENSLSHTAGEQLHHEPHRIVL